MARKGWVVIGIADDGVREIGDGLGDLAKNRRAGDAAKGGAERYQGKIESVKASVVVQLWRADSALKWTRR